LQIKNSDKPGFYYWLNNFNEGDRPQASFGPSLLVGPFEDFFGEIKKPGFLNNTFANFL
jgi:hypothetical protein